MGVAPCLILIMQIFVEGCGEWTITIEAQGSDTVESFKRKIEARKGIPWDRQRLAITHYVYLKDDRTLDECTVKTESVLHFTHRPISLDWPAGTPARILEDAVRECPTYAEFADRASAAVVLGAGCAMSRKSSCSFLALIIRDFKKVERPLDRLRWLLENGAYVHGPVWYGEGSPLNLALKFMEAPHIRESADKFVNLFLDFGSMCPPHLPCMHGNAQLNTANGQIKLLSDATNSRLQQVVERVNAHVRERGVLPVLFFDYEGSAAVVSIESRGDTTITLAELEEAFCKQFDKSLWRLSVYSNQITRRISAFESFVVNGTLPRNDPDCEKRLYVEIFGELPVAYRAKIFANSLCLRIPEAALGDLDSAPLLGQGSTSEVRLCSYLGTRVAAKRLFAVFIAGQCWKLEREIADLGSLRHPNIITCLGASLAQNKRPCVVLELLEGGSLDSLPAEMRDSERLTLCVQVARALRFMHGQKPILIHGNVKPANILLDRERRTAKLCGFGLTRALQTAVSTSIVGRPVYCAPEVFDPDPKSTLETLAKIDVYAFAITLWEVMSRRKAFFEMGKNVMQIMRAIDRGERPDVSLLPNCVPQALITTSWDADCERRPEMSHLLAQLNFAAEMAERAHLEQLANSNMCVVCFVQPKSHILIPCGHLCLCSPCSEAIKQCPLCRSAVESAHRVFQ